MRVLRSIGIKAVLDGTLERELSASESGTASSESLRPAFGSGLVTLRQVRGNWGRTTKVRGSRRDARTEVRRLLRVVDTGEHVDPNRITVRNWQTTWRYATRQEVAPRTAERYAEIVNNFLSLRSATCN